MSQNPDERRISENIADNLQGIEDVLSNIRFYIVGIFIAISAIGLLYAFFLFYFLVINPQPR